MTIPEYVQSIPEIARLLVDANHVDVKVTESSASMREFIAGMLSYQPGWVTLLFRVRQVFVRFLGMRQHGIPRPLHMQPEAVSLTAGDKVGFFTIETAQAENHWVAGAAESHLTAYLGVAVEPLAAGRRRYYVITIVHYNRFTGPLYFNVIRPFHHIVVNQMMRAGAVAG